MPHAHAAALRFAAGCYFQDKAGNRYRIVAVDGSRCTVRLIDGFRLEAPRSVVNSFECHLLAPEQVHRDVCAAFIESAFHVEEGSRQGILSGDDLTGASSLSPSTVVRKKRFRKTLALSPQTIKWFAQTWGPDVLTDFFIRLPTLGGYYESSVEMFSHPQDQWVSASLMTRSRNEEVGRKQYPYIKGTVPNLEVYHDASKPRTIIPHLHLVTDDAALRRIAFKAKCPAVKEAAKRVLGSRKRKK